MENKNRPVNAIPKDRDIAEFEKNGLTKREYFAAMAMQGILSGNEIARTGKTRIKSIAEYSIQAADELLKQLEDGKQ